MRKFALALLLVLAISMLPAIAKSMVPIDGKRNAIDQDLKSKLDSVLVRVSMSKEASDKTEQPHSMLLYAGSFRIESPSFTANGKPTSTAEQISKAELSALLDVLKNNKVYDRALKYHSERTAPDKKFPPPKDSKEFMPDPGNTNAEIQITTNDEHWYTYYSMRLPAKESAPIFKQCSDVLSGKAKSSLADLARKSE